MNAVVYILQTYPYEVVYTGLTINVVMWSIIARDLYQMFHRTGRYSAK